MSDDGESSGNDARGEPGRSPRASVPLGLRLAPVLVWFGLIFYQSSRSTLPYPRGISAPLISMAGHFAEYAVLAALLWWGIEWFLADQRRRTLVVLGVALVYAISDEWHQSFVPGRTPDVWDVVVDMIGATAGIVVARWILGKFGEQGRRTMMIVMASGRVDHCPQRDDRRLGPEQGA